MWGVSRSESVRCNGCVDVHKKGPPSWKVVRVGPKAYHR